MRAYIKSVPGSAATKDRVSPVTVRGPQSVITRSVAQLVLNPSRIRKVPGQMGVSRQTTDQSEINSVARLPFFQQLEASTSRNEFSICLSS